MNVPDNMVFGWTTGGDTTHCAHEWFATPDISPNETCGRCGSVRPRRQVSVVNVAFVYDSGNADGTVGGAELTMREFAKAAPKNVTLVDDVDQAETVVVGNCVSFDPDLIERLAGKQVVRYHNDLARHEHVRLREWLERNAIHVFTSPSHRKLYGLGGVCVPPALKLRQFRKGQKGDAEGAVAIAPWQNPGKGQQALREWADENGTVDVYGPGPFQPQGKNLRLHGPLAPSKVAQTLRRYDTFVHLPSEPEPFGRTVVEAWATGLRVVTNEQVGALYYLREAPEKLESAAEDFWSVVCG